MRTPVGILGFRGYSGAELVTLLERHPRAEPVLLEHREAAPGVSKDDKPQPLGRPGPRRVAYSPEAVRAEGLAAVFLATPPEVSLELAPPLLAAGTKVVDLSGAFRLGTAQNYARWYKETHTQPELLAEAVYSVPEFHRARVPGARLISNPGCYPTAANLAIKPLIDAGVVRREAGIVCDAKSGVSGAGRKPSLKTSFCEVTENFSAYSILDHRHVPEILRTSGIEDSELSFIAQLIPIDRGILETICFRAQGVRAAEDLLSIYQKAYADEPFLRIYPQRQVPDLRAVARTNFCDIGAHYDPDSGRAVVISAIDNLVKGAAGQAIQNMNLVLGFPETDGLL
jgi:N-acetyl-gamma-glutamyl-phosphate reductase